MQNNLYKWIKSQIRQITHWVTPPGIKASTIAQYLKQGPALLLFTPRNFQADSIDAYTMVSKVILDFRV